MNSHIDESVAVSELSVQSLGDWLKERREFLGLTRIDVASQLNLRLDIIEALETNDYSSISRVVFARGYLRSYAKLLGLPADEIIRLFNDLKWSEPASIYASAPLQTIQPPQKKEYAITHWLALGLLVLIFCIVGFWTSTTSLFNSSIQLEKQNLKQTKSIQKKNTPQTPVTESHSMGSETIQYSSLPDVDKILHEH